MPNRMFAILGVLLALLLPAAAHADDWVAIKLRGDVLQLVDGAWQELGRGDVVPDDRVIRTLRNGRVDFARDSETISLAGNTQIQIRDKAGERYTAVTQYFGTVEVEAEVRNVRHFEVRTPFLAAVVKGTRFIVKSGKDESSVEVKRGRVEVTDVHTGLNALVPAGQTATVTAEGAFALKGRGASRNSVLGPDGVVIGVGGVSASVAANGVAVSVGTPVGVSVGVTAGTGGAAVEADVGDVASADVEVDAGGADVEVNVGGASVGASVGSGGVSVGVGPIKLKLL
jgi:hypothetical protein